MQSNLGGGGAYPTSHPQRIGSEPIGGYEHQPLDQPALFDRYGMPRGVGSGGYDSHGIPGCQPSMGPPNLMGGPNGGPPMSMKSHMMPPAVGDLGYGLPPNRYNRNIARILLIKVFPAESS